MKGLVHELHDEQHGLVGRVVHNAVHLHHELRAHAAHDANLLLETGFRLRRHPWQQLLRSNTGTALARGPVYHAEATLAQRLGCIQHDVCARDEMGVPTWAPTRDVALCVVGFVCESRAGRDPVGP